MKLKTKYCWARYRGRIDYQIIEIYDNDIIHVCGSDEALKRSEFDYIGPEIPKPDIEQGATPHRRVRKRLAVRPGEG